MFAGLTRGIDIRLASNRIALGVWLVSLGTFVALVIFDHRYTYTTAVAGSIAVFLGWACGRELDPDRPHTATVSVVLALLAGVVMPASALVVGAALLALRLSSGTVGRWLTPIDLVLVAIIGFGSGGHLWGWPIAIVAVIALRFAPEIGSLRWVAIGVLIVAFVVAWYLGDLNPIDLSAESLWLVVGVTAATVVAISRVSVSGRADRRSVSLSETRVVYARLSAGIIAVWATFVGGHDAFWMVAPVVAALLGAALSTILLFRPKPKDQAQSVEVT